MYLLDALVLEMHFLFSAYQLTGKLEITNVNAKAQRTKAKNACIKVEGFKKQEKGDMATILNSSNAFALLRILSIIKSHQKIVRQGTVISI